MTEQDAAAMKARIVQKVGRKLDLDEAQKGKLGALADALREQHNALVGSAADPRAELQRLVSGPRFDREAAGALVQAKVSAVNAKSPALVAAMADFFDSLKPAQQAQLREFVARRGPHRS
jgi:Spy/CpxP family protein refolding chaperone